MTIVTGMALLCVPCAPGLLCAAFCFVLASLPLLTGIIMTGVRLMSRAGEWCSANDYIYNAEDELSFASDATKMYNLWIASIALIIPFLICTFFGGLLSVLAF